MGFWVDLEAVDERRKEMWREADERRLAKSLLAERRTMAHGGDSVGEGVEVRWGLDSDEPRLARLMELNGKPRWSAFEEKFVVAERNGEVLAAVRYRTESKRLVLGEFVADPWAGEAWLAAAMYEGAAELARALGAREVLVKGESRGYPGMAGYRRRGGDWRLDREGSTVRHRQLPESGWQRAMAMLGIAATPFHRAFRG